MAFKQEFGVPLQAEEEGVRRMFDRFNDSIRRRCAGDEGMPDRFHRLVVRAVYPHTGVFDDSIEQAAGCDGDAVAELNGRCRLSMLQHMVDLGRQVLVEASSAGDIHGLHASADGQSWDVLADGEMDQVQFEAGAAFGDDRKGESLSFCVEARV